MREKLEIDPRLERLIGRTRLIILAERLWPAVVLAACVLAAFVAVSWSGLWLVAPVWLRPVGVALAASALGVAVVLGWRGASVARGDVLRRLDRDSGQPHRPVSAREDRLADPSPDPFTRALWDAHRRRLDAAAAAVRPRPPSPRLVDRDRFAIRAAVLLLLVGTAFVAGVDKRGRLALAFDWHSAAAAAAAGFRLDAWVDPPPYTGRAPVLLAGAAGAAPSAPAGDGTASAVSVPVGSTLVVRSSGEGEVAATAEGGLKRADAKSEPKGGIAEFRFTVAGDGTLAVTRDGTRIAAFALKTVPDLVPTIALVGGPKANLRGTLTLTYKTGDDYGVIGVEAAFSNPVLNGRSVTGHTLAEAPKLPLTLPNGARGIGQGQTTGDLSDHPWAGAEVTLVLSARDEGGNVGFSAPVTMTLPTRPFHKPLAKALVEQRRDLVLNPDGRDHVDKALEALLLFPDAFDTSPAAFLGMTSARNRLRQARTDADLVGVADLLWSMALSIEDGDLSQTERDLRAAQQALREAIARHAPPEEIRRLTEALKQQLDKLLSDLARKGAQSTDRSPSDRGAKTVTQDDLQRLLDRLEQSARDGDTARAQALLEQLQNILENLRSAQGSSQDGKAKQSMNALDKMMRDQQALRDKTFRRGNDQRRMQPNGDGGLDDGDGEPQQPNDEAGRQGGEQDGAGQNGDLQGQQQALREQLDQLQKQMRELGLEGEKGFGEAEQAMKDAEGALGQGGRGDDQAVEAQGRALQGLQRGARGLQRQLAQRGEGGQDGRGSAQDGIGRENGTGDQTGTDPLGRERNGGLDAQHGLDAGEGLAERARQVLEELRRRLGDRLRPQDEQDYLERLLKRY